MTVQMNVRKDEAYSVPHSEKAILETIEAMEHRARTGGEDVCALAAKMLTAYNNIRVDFESGRVIAVLDSK